MSFGISIYPPPSDLTAGLPRYSSTSRPVNPYFGMLIFETDTGRIMKWNGTVWCGTIDVVNQGFGTSHTGFSASTTVATLTMPDQGCAGQITVVGMVRCDQSVATDVFQAAISASPSGAILNYTHGPVSPSGGLWVHQPAALIGQAAGAATTINMVLNRDSGSGTGTTYAGTATAPNFIIATFVPNQ